MPEESVIIKTVDASCAAAVPMIFRSIYGDNYPVEYVYHGDLILAEIAAGRLHASIALDSQGEPAGYTAIIQSASNPRLWEGCNLMVVPGKGDEQMAWNLMLHYLQPENLPASCDACFSESVCFHSFVQLTCAKLGIPCCALALDQMQGSGFVEHRPATERVACLLLFNECSDPVGLCYLPDQYFEPLRNLLQGLRPRSFATASAALPRTGKTVLHAQWHHQAGMCRMSVRSIGGDWEAVLIEILGQARRHKVVSLQLVLSTDIPYLSAAVEKMRQRGFFFGGLFPRWFGADGVMMQQVMLNEPDYQGIRLYGDRAKQLLAFIRKDRESVLTQFSELSSGK